MSKNLFQTNEAFWILFHLQVKGDYAVLLLKKSIADHHCFSRYSSFSQNQDVSWNIMWDHKYFIVIIIYIIIQHSNFHNCKVTSFPTDNWRHLGNQKQSEMSISSHSRNYLFWFKIITYFCNFKNIIFLLEAKLFC